MIDSQYLTISSSDPHPTLAMAATIYRECVSSSSGDGLLWGGSYNIDALLLALSLC